MYTGERPCGCEEPGCGNAATQLSNLKAHLRAARGASPAPPPAAAKRARSFYLACICYITQPHFSSTP